MQQRKSKLSQLKPILPVLLPLSVLIFTGLWGVDYGYHWDESKVVPLLRNTIRSGSFLPGWYRYPSVTYWLNLLALLPYVGGIVLRGGAPLQEFQSYLIEVVGGDVFKLQTRIIFIVVSSLSVLWVYSSIFVWRKKNWLEALIGASLLAFSWEVAYHSRWITPDAILMQFGALTLCCGLQALHSDRKGRLWLWAAAFAAGLGMGTKYPGGLLLLPVLVAAYRLKSRFGWKSFGEGLIVFSLGFFISTPGALFQFQTFFKDVLAEVTHYTSDHYGYSLSPIEHLGLIGIYFSRVVFSHFQVLAFAIFVFALAGGYALAKNSLSDAVLILSFPLFYVLFFSFQRVMIVRNLLVVIPFMAVLAARGWGFIWERTAKPSWRVVVGGLAVMALLLNAGWLAYAADSIQKRASDDFIQQFMAYAERHSQRRFFASEKVWQALLSSGMAVPENISHTDVGETSNVVLYLSESVAHPTDWPRNQPGLVTALFGPWEVNFDYYPTWIGDDRILVMPLEQAQELKVKALHGDG